MNLEARSQVVLDAKLREAMIEHGRPVHTETWQGRDISALPAASMFELLNVTTTLNLRRITSHDHWRAEVRPNLPWADEHFLERVSGEPLNPPPSWVRWPWANSADQFRESTKFNHTYPERFWPKYAGEGGHAFGGRIAENEEPHRGIRWTYGDLADVVTLLRQQPLTRQAYLPMFFPEDTGIGDGGRKPCTLGYQFIMRGGLLHCYYPMRSCDLVRHYRDDVYFAIRLLLWVLEQLQQVPAEGSAGNTSAWFPVMPGTLTMHMTSLHCFVNDMIALKKERGQ